MVTSGNLRDRFAPGEQLTLTVTDTIQNRADPVGSGSMNHPGTWVRPDLYPDWEALMEGVPSTWISLDQPGVFPPGGQIVPVPGAVLLAGIGLGTAEWVRRRKAV
jgi:hypothetical protein